MSLDSWDPVLDLLPARYRGIAYDLRGFGRSGAGSSYTLEDHAEDLGALMDALGIECAALVGHSLGGNIAQMAVVAAPARVAALVLTNAPARNTPAPDPGAGAVAERVAAYGSIEDNRRVLAAKMPAYFHRRNVEPADLTRFIEIGSRGQTEALRQTLHALYHHSVIEAAEFDRYRGPVLVVGGELDQVTPMAVCTSIREVLPQAEFVTISGSGHSPMWEKPTEWSGAVYGFLDRVT
jgi:3-oxoadipate enol-lactonase